MRPKKEQRPTSNGQISEEEPARDEGLFGRTGGFAHDVQVRGVEAQGGGRQTVSYEVDPEKLDWDQSLRQTQSSSQEDTVGERKLKLNSFHSYDLLTY